MSVELTILMPCLNEEKSIGFAISEAKRYIERSGISAEILIADNGSTDESVAIAQSLGANIVHVAEKGYGNALRAGISASNGEYIIMGDCDGSYDFSHLDGFVDKLREGYSLVMGNRYQGGIEKGAMPFVHKYIGVPFLSFAARLRYRTPYFDYHCGLRGFNREHALAINLKAEGMEFATEIIARFAQKRLPMCQVPTILRKDKREGKSHLRTIPDGLRHLKFILK